MVELARTNNITSVIKTEVDAFLAAVLSMTADNTALKDSIPFLDVLIRAHNNLRNATGRLGGAEIDNIVRE